MFKALKAIFRISLHTIAYMVCTIVILLYVAVRVNLAGTAIERLLTEQLSQQINTPIQVGKVELNWINQIVVTDLRVDTALYVRRAMVGYDIIPLLTEKRLQLSTAQLIDFDVRLSRDTAGVLNVQNILDAVSQKDDSNERKINQFQIGVFHLRRGNIRFYNCRENGVQEFCAFGLNSDVHLLDNNLTIRRMSFMAQTPYGNYDVESSLIDKTLNATLSNSDLSASVALHDITSPIDSMLCDIEIGNYVTSVNDFGTITLSGSLSGHLRSIDYNLSAITPAGNIRAIGTVSDTVRVDGTISSPLLDLRHLQSLIKTENTELLSHKIHNAKVTLSLDRHSGGDVQAMFALNDSVVSADISMETSVQNLSTVAFDLHSLSNVKVDARLNRLSLRDVPVISSDIKAEVTLSDREGYIEFDNTVLSMGGDTLFLEPMIVEGTRYSGYIKGPVLHADYTNARSLGMLKVKGYIPNINHINKFIKFPLQLNGRIPFELNVDSTFTTASGHIDFPAFSIKTFQYESPLSVDVKADLQQHRYNLYPTRDIDLGAILGRLNSKAAHVGGLARGPITISNGIAQADLFVRNFSYIDTLIGDANILVGYDFNKSYIGLDAHVDARTRRPSHITGGIGLPKPSEGRNKTELDLDFQTDSLPLGFINVWTGSFLQNFTGTVTGHVALKGPTSELLLVGHPRVDGTFTNELVGTRFHLHDSFVLDTTAMVFRDAHVYDDEHNLLRLNAVIEHSYLDDFKYDVNLSTNEDFLLFDKPVAAKGAQYWGQLYTNGTARLHNLQGPLNIELDMTTANGSWLNLSPYAARIDDKASYSFLTFRDAQSEPEASAPSAASHTTQSSAGSSLLATLRVSATELCRISVRLDPLSVTDELQCRGNGNLVLQYDPRNDLTIGGTFNITSGNYNINLQSGLLNRMFSLQSGSTVHFNGVPSDADLNINASYTVPSANLKDLDENIVTLGSLGRTTVPVDCQLAVTGQLSQPQVGFDLSLRNVSDEVQAYVHNIIGTPEMLNQEVLYLLLFNRFYTPDYAQQSTRTNRGGGELASFASSSVTAGLNQLINKVSDHVSIGSSVISERGDFSDVQADISLTTRFLDNRLVLGGNFGYRDPSSSRGAGNASKFIGDFDAEFLMNTRGTVRIKAYSHSSQRDYNINNAQTTQGLGIIIRKDF